MLLLSLTNRSGKQWNISAIIRCTPMRMKYNARALLQYRAATGLELQGKLFAGRKIRNIKYISFINIRLSHQIPGCADRVMPYIKSGKNVYHTLIISPPRCGKTTILREIIQVSTSPDGINVGVVGNRLKIAACYMGVPQNDVGIRTDVLDCCPKAEGMMMPIRSMSPQVIAVDEVAGS